MQPWPKRTIRLRGTLGGCWVEGLPACTALGGLEFRSSTSAGGEMEYNRRQLKQDMHTMCG